MSIESLKIYDRYEKCSKCGSTKKRIEHNNVKDIIECTCLECNYSWTRLPRDVEYTTEYWADYLFNVAFDLIDKIDLDSRGELESKENEKE